MTGLINDTFLLMEMTMLSAPHWFFCVFVCSHPLSLSPSLSLSLSPSLSFSSSFPCLIFSWRLAEAKTEHPHLKKLKTVFIRNNTSNRLRMVLRVWLTCLCLTSPSVSSLASPLSAEGTTPHNVLLHD